MAFARTLDEQSDKGGVVTNERTLTPLPAGPACADGDRRRHLSVEGRKSLALQLFGSLQQSGDDDPDRADEADPDPRSATREEERVGIEISLTSTSTVAIEPIAMAIKALGNRGRHVDPDLAQHDEEHGQKP